jgi:hypothetical protein
VHEISSNYEQKKCNDVPEPYILLLNVIDHAFAFLSRI